MMVKLSEKKYQAIYLFTSGKISLTELKAMFRVGYVAATNEYSSAQDQKDFLGTKARLEKLARLTETRDVAKQRMIMRFTPKPKLSGDRTMAIAETATGFKGDKSFRRFPPMPPHRNSKPRPGSSKGKIGRTRYVGFKEFNKRFDALMNSLANLSGPNSAAGKQIAGRLQRMRQGIKISAKPR